HRITVTLPGYGAVSTWVAVPVGRDVDVAIERAVAMRIVLIDAVTGSAPSEARVGIIDAEPPHCGWASAALEPMAADGDAFLVSGLSRGTYDLRVAVPDRAPVVLRDVEAPGEARVTVERGGLVELHGHTGT